MEKDTLQHKMETMSVAFLVTTSFCQQNKSAKYLVSLICSEGGGGALWASGDATWGVQHSINKEKNQGTFDSFSTLVVNKMLPFAGGISDWPFRSSLGITLMQIGARLAGDPQERKSIWPVKKP